MRSDLLTEDDSVLLESVLMIKESTDSAEN